MQNQKTSYILVQRLLALIHKELTQNLIYADMEHFDYFDAKQSLRIQKGGFFFYWEDSREGPTVLT